MKELHLSYRVTMGALCEKAGRSRQNYYKTHQKRQQEEVNENHVVELVRRERSIPPRMGGRKLLHILSGQLLEDGIKVGRDKLFDILRKNGLLLDPLPSITLLAHVNQRFPGTAFVRCGATF